MAILIARNPQIITLSTPHNPQEYYQTRDGLYVYSDFRVRIVDKREGEKNTEPLPAGTRIVVGSADIGAYLTPSDKQIEARLPGGHHICERTTLCAGAAAMIDAQQGGIAGVLDHTGAATVAYTLHWVVYIYHDAMNQKWTPATWPRGGDRFRPVKRVVWFRIEV